MNLLCRARVLHGLQRTTALELGASSLDPGTLTLVSHSILLPPPIPLLCYLPFLECVSSAAPLILHQLPRWAELWHTESAAEVAGSGCDRHWPLPAATPPHKLSTFLNVPATLSLSCLGTCTFDVLQPFLQQHLNSCAKAPAFLIQLCQNQEKRVRKAWGKLKENKVFAFRKGRKYQ